MNLQCEIDIIIFEADLREAITKAREFRESNVRGFARRGTLADVYIGMR